MKSAQEQLNESQKHFLVDQVEINLNRALIVSGALLMVKYLQTFDVIKLIIKQCNIGKQEKQLHTYFESRDEGVIIYNLKPGTPEE